MQERITDRPADIRTQPDEELIAAFQNGRRDAFDVLVGRYKNPLHNFAYRFLGDYDEAEDVVQEVFVRLYLKKEAYRPIAKFSTWIYTIAGNLARTHLRRRKFSVLFSMDRGEHRSGTTPEIPDVRYPADRGAERAIQDEMIQDALNAIDPKFREVVVLCDIQELSYEEICDITGLNIGTVKSRLNRGRTQLRRLLQDLMKE